QAGGGVEEADEEVGAAPGRRPDLAVELLVVELAPSRVEREEDGSGLVDLVQAPRAGQGPAGVLSLKPQALRRLRLHEPAARGPGEILPTARQVREDGEGEIARPDEAVAARLDEVRI